MKSKYLYVSVLYLNTDKAGICPGMKIPAV